MIEARSDAVQSQYCIGTWNVRSMNQGKLEVVKQEMARVNIDILGISELKWTAATAKSLQLCPTLCDPIDSNPPGSPVPGILQARLEWVAIYFCRDLGAGLGVLSSFPRPGLGSSPLPYVDPSERALMNSLHP